MLKFLGAEPNLGVGGEATKRGQKLRWGANRSVRRYSEYMRIQDIVDADDCVGGEFMKEVIFDGPVVREFILHLGESGDLDYFEDCARPCYRLDVPGSFTLKGIQGAKNARLILISEDMDRHLAEFKSVVANFNGVDAAPVQIVSDERHTR